MPPPDPNPKAKVMERKSWARGVEKLRTGRPGAEQMVRMRDDLGNTLCFETFSYLDVWADINAKKNSRFLATFGPLDEEEPEIFREHAT